METIARIAVCAAILACPAACQAAEDNDQTMIDALVSKNPRTKGSSSEELPPPHGPTKRMHEYERSTKPSLPKADRSYQF